MTTVLQHQFWDLKVSEDAFEVGLSFGGVPETLMVPFEAIKSFFDPSIQFGLQFETIEEGGQQGAAAPKANKPDEKPKAKPRARHDANKPALPAATPPRVEPQPASKASPKTEKPGGEVVQLDRFRKK